MKLTQSQLKNLISEELSKLLEDGTQDGYEQNRPGRTIGKLPPGTTTSYGHVKKVDEGDEGDEREEHNIDDLWADVRNLTKRVKALEGKR